MALRKLRKNPRPEPPAPTGSATVQTELDRPTADEIYEQVSRNARHELDRAALGLAISGLAGGMTMGLTALSTSIVIAILGKVPQHDSSPTFFTPLASSPSFSAGLNCLQKTRSIRWH